jgi:hypothetical protein
MTESIDNTPIVEHITQPKNRSAAALVIFLFFALPMPLCLFLYHFILWSTEQSAITSLSLKNLAWSGPHWPGGAGTCPIRCGWVIVALHNG